MKAVAEVSSQLARPGTRAGYREKQGPNLKHSRIRLASAILMFPLFEELFDVETLIPVPSLAQNRRVHANIGVLSLQ